MENILSTLNIVWKLVFIIFFFGFCIFIHEFGHLLAALWMKLHVEKFSVCFGKAIWSRMYKGVEYAIGWLPLGGYVALPQLDPSDHPQTSDGKPLPVARPLPRMVTAFAGPFFNILFGFVLASVMWVVGVWESPQATSCVVTEVPQSLPLYKNGLEFSDEIVALDGKPCSLFLEEICLDLAPDSGKHELTVLRDGEEEKIEFEPEANPEWTAGLRKGDRIVAVNGKAIKQGREGLMNEYLFNDAPEVTLSVIREDKPLELHFSPLPNPLYENLGAPFFRFRNPLPVSGVQADSPAAKAGLQTGDQLLALDDTSILSGTQFMRLLKPGQAFTLLIVRNGQEIRTPEIVCPEPATMSALGIHFSVTVNVALDDSPAKKAGFRARDQILAVDGQDIADAKQLTEYIRASEGKEMSFRVLRDGSKQVNLVCAAKEQELEGKKTWLLGVQLGDSMPKVIAYPNPWKQFSKIAVQTGRTLDRLFSPITSKIRGRAHGKATVKVEHMSGPLGIFMMLWYSLKEEGLRGGLSFIVLITFSLAFMNLLPLPVLDGGHILQGCIEIIIRRRLPAKFVSILYNVFAVLLVSLILYITFFDGRRMVRLISTGSTKGKAVKVEKKSIQEKKPAKAPQTQEQNAK